jgi:DNA-binding FadR family transcriptional regulator
MPRSEDLGPSYGEPSCFDLNPRSCAINVAPGQIDQSMNEHTEIIEAICTDDLDRAETAIQPHLSNITDILARSSTVLARNAI